MNELKLAKKRQFLRELLRKHSADYNRALSEASIILNPSTSAIELDHPANILAIVNAAKMNGFDMDSDFIKDNIDEVERGILVLQDEVKKGRIENATPELSKPKEKALINKKPNLSKFDRLAMDYAGNDSSKMLKAESKLKDFFKKIDIKERKNILKTHPILKGIELSKKIPLFGMSKTEFYRPEPRE